MKKIYIIKDRTFEVSIELYFRPFYIIEFYEIKYPNRKFFKGKTLKGSSIRGINRFETVDDMVLDALKEKFTFETNTKVEDKKWEDFKKTLDEPYIL